VIYGTWTFGGKGREVSRGGEPETEIADKRAFVSVIKLMNERVHASRIMFTVRRYRDSSRLARYHFGSKPVRLAVVQRRRRRRERGISIATT